MTSALLPVELTAPALTPTAPHGLYAATAFTDTTEPAAPLRWLPSGVRIRPTNYGFETGFGVWGAPWCVDPDLLEPEDIKDGERPDISELAPFTALTVFGVDHNQCGDLTGESRAEVRARATHNLELHEQVAVEREFTATLLADAATITPTSAANLTGAIAHIEEALAATATFGFIHARAGLLAVAEAHRLIIRDGGVLRTPAGHRWIFGGGYAAGSLGDTLVATAAPIGFRGAVAVREATRHATNQYVVVAERSVLIGYEAALAAATIEASE